ncbi:dynein regulatory complex protein 8 [Rhincodon typus]|uniref:dynein regulatory complex protein 8 n=1 Tax=Rhincodon typus TaxID=259920 RepID=UPI00202F3418|nr:dynein regulatory complex protein 8 [Rhincodon typus]
MRKDMRKIRKKNNSCSLTLRDPIIFSPWIDKNKCPGSQAEEDLVELAIRDFIQMHKEVEEEEPTGYIQLEKFLPMMTRVLLERKYRPQPEDVILRAFEVLDQTKKGYLTQEELTKYLTEEGEPFTQEEMEEMLSAAVDPEKNVIFYKDFAAMMTIEDT